MIKENQKYLNRFQVILDIAVILISLLLAWYFRFKSGLVNSNGYLPFTQYLKPVICITPVYLILYNMVDLYTPYRFKSIYEEFINILKANIFGLLVFVMMLFLFKEIDYSRYLLLIFTLISIVLATVERVIIRLILRRFRKKGYNLKHILLIGNSELTVEFLKRTKKNKHWGYEVIGILDDSFNIDSNIINFNEIKKGNNIEKDASDEVASDCYDSKVIGRLADLEEYLCKFNVDEVFITLNIKEYDKLGSIISICEKNGVRTEIIPDYYKYIPARPYVEELDGLAVINIRYLPLDNLANRFLKRIFDGILSLVAIAIVSPIIILTALIIKLTSNGPIIFKQERIGLNNKPFIMYKFRSMKLQDDRDEKIQWTTADDPRKTKFGSFIRKTSIDELPQLFNVFKGDMSLVGPRPERPYFVSKFKEEIPKYMVKHQVRPGITGWAQVNGWRGDTSIEKRIECDIYYIENWSFSMDIKIMFLTIFKGFVNKNAY